MFSDPWLQNWLPLVVTHSSHTAVLEIGCGYGDDTVTLCESGLKVIALDISRHCVAVAQQRAPSANIWQLDLREEFPKDWPQFGVVIASLSLHYFDWPQTVALVEKIWNLLPQRGVFLCRLNSTEDFNFGAQDGTPIEENFYVVSGQPKRFFDQKSLAQLFAKEWNVLSCQQKKTRKYVRTKVLWELVLEKRSLS